MTKERMIKTKNQESILKKIANLKKEKRNHIAVRHNFLQIKARMTDLFHQGKETSLIAHQAGLNVLKSPTHHITHVDNVDKAVSLIKMIKNR